MLIYKRANFAPNGPEAKAESESKTDEAKKIQELKNEIKDLRDNNPENDGFNAEIMANNELNSALTDALLKPENRKTLNNLVKELSKILEKKNYNTEGLNLLNLLVGVQEKAEFNRVNEIMSKTKEQGGIKLNDLGKINDQEIKLVCDYIKHNIVSPECVNLHNLFVRFGVNMINSITDKKAKENFTKIKNSLTENGGGSTVAIESELSNKQLAEIFTDLNAPKFQSILKDYTNITDWKGTNLEEGQIGFKNNGKNFIEGEFVAYFNGANESRISKNESIASEFSLGEALTDDILKNNNFTVKNNNLLYNGQPCTNEDIKTVFGAQINPALEGGIFFGGEKAAIETKICDKITNEIKDKLQNSDQEVNKDKWTMKLDNFNAIKDALGDRMFINIDAEGKVTYIPQKAKAYLSGYRNKEWLDIKKDFKTPNGMAYVAALQILLNVDHDANINVDGIWKDGGETQKAVQTFQENYNNNLPIDGVKIEKVDGLPGKITLEALLDGQYGDAGLDGQWKVNPDGTGQFLDGTEIKEKDGKKYITIDGQDYYEYTEGMEGPGYQFGKNNDHESRLYVGSFKDGAYQGDGTTTRSHGEKYVGKREKGCRTEGTYTWPAGTPDNFREYVGKFTWDDNAKKHIMSGGIMTYENNDKYEGAFNKENKKQGDGTFTWANGNILKGNWNSNGEITRGTVKIPNTPDLEVVPVEKGDKLKVTSEGPFKDKLIIAGTGEFVDATQAAEAPQSKDPTVVDGIGKFGEGGFVFDEGKINTLNGNNYVKIGSDTYYEYRNNLTGTGYLTFPGNEHRQAYLLYGTFKDGKIKSGTFIEANGEKYVGNFENGTFSGEGEITRFDGTIVKSSNFENGSMKGNCDITFGNSTDYKDETGQWKSYNGGFENGFFQGEGTLTWTDGSTCKGNWEKGAANGDNVIVTFHDGLGTLVGRFENGLIKQGTLTFSNGETFTGTFNDKGAPDKGKFKKDANSDEIEVTGDENGLKNGNDYVYQWKYGNGSGSSSTNDQPQRFVSFHSNIVGRPMPHPGKREVLAPGQI